MNNSPNIDYKTSYKEMVEQNKVMMMSLLLWKVSLVNSYQDDKVKELTNSCNELYNDLLRNQRRLVKLTNANRRKASKKKSTKLT